MRGGLFVVTMRGGLFVCRQYDAFDALFVRQKSWCGIDNRVDAQQARRLQRQWGAQSERRVVAAGE